MASGCDPAPLCGLIAWRPARACGCATWPRRAWSASCGAGGRPGRAAGDVGHRAHAVRRGARLGQRDANHGRVCGCVRCPCILCSIAAFGIVLSRSPASAQQRQLQRCISSLLNVFVICIGFQVIVDPCLPRYFCTSRLSFLQRSTFPRAALGIHLAHPRDVPGGTCPRLRLARRHRGVAVRARAALGRRARVRAAAGLLEFLPSATDLFVVFGSKD